MSKLLCLMYHDISEGPVKDKYSLTAVQFAEHLAVIKQSHLPALTTADLFAFSREKGVVISFDDGFSGNWRVAAPLLAENSLRATFFVTTGFLATPGYMTWDNVVALSKKGFDIQSHTHSHALLSGASEEKIKKELQISKDILEQKLGKAVRALSVPGGRYDQRVINISWECGYEYIFTSVPGITRLNKSTRVFKRMLIKKDITGAALRKILAGDAFYFGRARMLYMVRAAVKSAIGSNRYHALWRKYYKEGK